MVQDRAIVTTADQQIKKVIGLHGLSNRAILNDFERPQRDILRSGHSLMLNICEMTRVLSSESMTSNCWAYISILPLLGQNTLTTLQKRQPSGYIF